MERHPVFLLFALFFIVETFAMLLALYGAPVIVYAPIALAFPAFFLVTAVKVTVDVIRGKL